MYKVIVSASERALLNGRPLLVDVLVQENVIYFAMFVYMSSQIKLS
jgi:hypothetical protein